MIEKREEARREREEKEEENKESHPLDDVMKEVENERKRKAHPSLQWRGKISAEQRERNMYSKRQKRAEAQKSKITRIPTLFQLCVDFVVTNFEHVEALGNVDSSIRRTVCNELVAKKKLDGAAFEVLTEAGMESLEVIDCAEVTQEQLAKSLALLLPAGLRYLLLHHSGRCFGSQAVNTICKLSSKSQLFAISIAGAYLLQDADASLLLDSMAKNLSSIEFKACPNLGSSFCEGLSSNYSKDGGGHLLELSLEDLQLSKENLLPLAGTDALRNLKSLTLRHLENVDDEIVTKIFKGCQDLESIDLMGCYQITDDSLSAIRSGNVNGTLRSLQLGGLKNLSEAGLETLFTPVIPGLPSPPMLRKIDLSSCHYKSVTDNILDLICKASSMKRDQSGEISQQLSTIGGLVHVNINGSSCSDTTMECLVSTCSSSLKELSISFAPNITDKGLGYLVSNVGSQLRKIHIWGCAQVGEEFLDGHERVDDPSLHVIGAWIKKGNMQSSK